MYALIAFAGLLVAQFPPLPKPVSEPPAKVDAKPILIRPIFVQGQSLVYRLEQEKSVTLRGREDTPFVTRSVSTFRLTPRTISAAETELVAAFERLEWSITGSAADFTFDTARPFRSGEAPYLAFARRAINREFDVMVDGLTSIPRVARLDSLYVQKPTKGEEPQIPYGAARAEEILGPAALANLFRGLFSWYPNDAVYAGKAWDRQEKFPFGANSLVRTNTVWLTAADDRRMVLRSKIEIDTASTEKPTQRPANLPVQFIPGEPGSATIVYRKNPGVVESIDAQLAFGMKTRSQPSAQNPTGELTQNLRAKSALKLLEIRQPQRAAN